MKNHALASILFIALAAPAAAQASADKAEMKQYYDKAFELYVAGDYAKAIEQWNLVLREDPKQATAKNMIEEARKKLAGTSGELKRSFNALVARGRYSDALIKLEEMLATDSTNPHYLKTQDRLRTIADITPVRPGRARGWDAAGEGITSWLGEREDLPFAYDALRYASEQSPSDKAFPRLLAALEEESPQLRLNDTKPANVGILEHKKEKALHQIYDAKYYLAVKELEGVLRLEPNDVTALKRAGSAYLQLKNYTQARRAWQKAMEISPEDAQLPEYLQALEKVAPAAETPRPARKAKPRKKA